MLATKLSSTYDKRFPDVYVVTRREFIVAMSGVGTFPSTLGPASGVATWEFGATGWCQFAAETALLLLRAANLDLNRFEWSMSERYDHTPARLKDGRDVVGFHVMITGGTLVAGPWVSEACLALDGLHTRGPWGLIAGAAAIPYGQAGQLRRWADEAVLMKAINSVTGRDVITPVKPTVLPDEIMRALVSGQETGGGLHNLTAARTAPSEELAGLPVTSMGVPIFNEMSAAQQAAYLKLLGD